MDVLLAAVIFVVSYLFIMMEKINRAIVALAGGMLLLLTGVYDVNDVFFQYIDWNTIALLFSMMVLISITERTGLFSFIAVRLAQQVGGSPIPLMAGVCGLTALGSALLDNVTTVLILVPIVLKITKQLQLPVFPYLLAVIFSSNIGGTATLIGDPPNIMIGQAVEHFTFLSFVIHLAPVAVIMFMIMILMLVPMFRKKLQTKEANKKQLMEMDASLYLVHSPMLYQSITVLLMTLTGFVLHAFLHIDLTVVALCGAILLLLLTEKEIPTEQVFSRVEWVTLFFFVGLFALVGGLQEAGIIDELARGIVRWTDGDYVGTAILILWMSGLFSGIVDNIPFVAAMIPIIEEFESYGMVYLDPIWWALALGACLGGNATLIGASANVVVAGLAEGNGEKLSFLRFMLYGVPFVLLSLGVATLYLYVRYLIPYMG
ncbi:ArsB/NhaD family transporter [Lentibacillus halophilus]|uniref:ArsB/NhaD family transporter n=1 Tax=Lentibacillus halophilus TaxID=295065 RepID=A0ABP3J5B9_9BACI